MKSLTVPLLLAAMLAAAGRLPAKADVVLPFELQTLVVYQGSSPGAVPTSIDSVLTIDTTTGPITNFESPPNPGPPFAVTVTQGFNPQANAFTYDLFSQRLGGGGGPYSGVFLVFDTSTLVGFAGGALADVNDPTSTGAFSFYFQSHVPDQDVVSGSVTPLPVPEPPSLSVLAVGAFGLLTWRVG